MTDIDLDPEPTTDSTPAVPKENHCPFGCPAGDLDELGYCEHLVGFTNYQAGEPDAKKVFEPIEPILDRDGNKTGSVRVCGGKKIKKIEKTDRIVNPVVRQFIQGRGYHLAKRWVSARVYRDKAK